MGTREEPKPGDHYQDAEVALIYLFEKTPEAHEILARLLHRTPGAVDFVMRWCDGANFPEEAHNKIRRQIATVRELLGDERRGCVRFH